MTPSDFALDPASGDLHVVDSTQHEVRVYGSAGALVRRYGGQGTADGLFVHPMCIVISNGWVHISDFNNSRIQRFSTDRDLDQLDVGVAEDGALSVS